MGLLASASERKQIPCLNAEFAFAQVFNLIFGDGSGEMLTASTDPIGIPEPAEGNVERIVIGWM